MSLEVHRSPQGPTVISKSGWVWHTFEDGGPTLGLDWKTYLVGEAPLYVSYVPPVQDEDCEDTLFTFFSNIPDDWYDNPEDE